MKYIDMHCDTLSVLYQWPECGHLDKNKICIDKEKLTKGQALCQYLACFVALTEHGNPENVKEIEAEGKANPDSKVYKRLWSDRADASYEYVLNLLDFYQKENEKAGLKTCLTAKDCETMEAVAKAAQTSKILGVQQSDDIYAILTVEEGGILNNDASRLDSIYNKGCRLVTLTWNFENCLGFPNSTNPDRMALGLKPFGKEIVEKMLSMGMLVDVSHLSDGGFKDVADICKAVGKPFVASHSCARSLRNHPRNLTDDMLKTIGNIGGVAGVNFYGNFLNDNAKSDIASIVAHIQHMVNCAGIEAVGLGSDFDGFDGGSELADASKMPELFDALKKSGFTYADIEKIAWKNGLRVAKNIFES